MLQLTTLAEAVVKMTQQQIYTKDGSLLSTTAHFYQEYIAPMTSFYLVSKPRKF